MDLIYYRNIWDEVEKAADEEIRLEIKRSSSILKAHDSIEAQSFKDIITEYEERDRGDCAICLESGGARTLHLLCCCGKYVCRHCQEQQPKTKGSVCILCGTQVDPDSMFSSLEKRAKQGDAWAQYLVGDLYYYGDTGEKKIDNDLAIYWLDVAVYNGHKLAGILLVEVLHRMGRLCSARAILEMLMPFDDTQYLKMLGYIYCFEERQNLEEGVRLLTIAAGRGNAISQFCLANCFRNGIGVEESLEVSLYWCTQAARQNHLGAQELVLTILFEKAMRMSCGMTDGNQKIHMLMYPGCSVIPALVRWHQLFVKNGGKSKRHIVDLEAYMNSSCNYCEKSEEELKEAKSEGNVDVEGKALKRCTQCRVVRYCSRDCQLQHWKAGHKRDCKMASAVGWNNPK